MRLLQFRRRRAAERTDRDIADNMARLLGVEPGRQSTPKPARNRLWLGSKWLSGAAALLWAFVGIAPAQAALLKAVADRLESIAPTIATGMRETAHAYRVLPAATFVLTHDTVLPTVTALDRLATQRDAPMLILGQPTGDEITGYVLNVDPSENVMASYLRVDELVAERHGCQGIDWFGPKPVVGAVHPIEADGRFSIQWASEESDAICDVLADQVAVAAIPKGVTPMPLLDRSNNAEFPAEVKDAALVWTTVARQPDTTWPTVAASLVDRD